MTGIAQKPESMPMTILNWLLVIRKISQARRLLVSKNRLSTYSSISGKNMKLELHTRNWKNILGSIFFTLLIFFFLRCYLRDLELLEPSAECSLRSSAYFRSISVIGLLSINSMKSIICSRWLYGIFDIAMISKKGWIARRISKV